tara:strand:- start:29066 stop:30058 length:993 start_codon:yes stop_codon:yes gene_type:complete
MKRLGTLFLIALFLLFSCKNGKKQAYLPSSIGPINSLAVIMDNELWKGEVGDKVREYFAAPVLSLTWDEPLFSINHFPPKSFTGATRAYRSILYVQKDSVNIGHIKTDMYASPQKVGVIKGRTNDEIMANLDREANDMIIAFKDLEIKESQKRFLKSLNKEGILEDRFNISMDIPSIYKVGKQQENFVWIDMPIPKGNKNVIVYAMPRKSLNNEATFVKDFIAMRDSIGKLYIPGPDVPGKTTHMMTEKAFAPNVFPAQIAGKKAVEVRGIWEINNYPMAGPYLTYIIDDPENNRKLVVEGFTFAPATEKRDYMFELEAILKTVRFNNKK